MPGQPPPPDPNTFANQAKVTVIYADNRSTVNQLQEMMTAASNVRFPFDALFEQDVPEGVIWYKDIPNEIGDGTVPRESSVGQFENDPRVTRLRVTEGDTSHTGLMGNRLVQQRILDILGVPWLEADISTGSGLSLDIGSWFGMSDPVELFLVDDQGRRLGYSRATGPLAEIPGSVWYGDVEGVGWVFGQEDPGLRVELAGVGDDYWVHVAGGADDIVGGLEESGFLADGEQRSAEIETAGGGGSTGTLLALVLVLHVLIAAVLVVLLLAIRRGRRRRV